MAIVRRGHAARNTQFDHTVGYWSRRKNHVPATRDEAKALLQGAKTKRERAFYQEALNKFPDPAHGRPTQRLAMGPVSKTGVRDERLEGSIPSPSANRFYSHPRGGYGSKSRLLLALAAAAVLASASSYE